MNKKSRTTIGEEAITLTASKIVTLIISLLTTMLLSRFRSLEEYGTYSQLLLVINLFSSLLMLGLPNSVNYFLAREETQEGKQRFLSVYYSISTVLSLIIGIVLVLSIPLIELYFHNTLIRKFYYFLAFYPWAMIVSSSIENVLVVYKQSRTLMIYRLVASIITLGTVVFVQSIGKGFREFMIIFTIINSLFAFSVYVITARISGGLKVIFDYSWIKKILIFSVPIGLATMVATLNVEIDKLLIGYLMSTEQMSIYTNAAKELPLSIVASSITAVLLPQLTLMIKRGRIKDALQLWNYSTELSFTIICMIVAGIFTYAEEVVTILYSSKYLPGVGVFRVYTLTLLLRVTYFGIILNSCGETKKIFYCSIISLVLNAILNPLSYWIIGMIGPAIATFISILFIQQLQLIMTSKVTSEPFTKLFPWKNCAIILIINILFSVVFKVVKIILPIEFYLGEVIESVMLGVVWAGFYLLVMKKNLLNLWHKMNISDIGNQIENNDIIYTQGQNI